jgi:co-chaperonin GroES (HSP10)
MNVGKMKLVPILCLLGSLGLSGLASGLPMASAASGLQQNAAPASAVRRIGVIKTINGNTISLTPLPPDTGTETTITVTETTRILRIAPGEKNLKSAATLQLQDLQVGDHILVGGKPSDDGKSITAASVVVMKASDVEAKQEQERQDWQKRGLGGLVCAVDASAGAVTISTTGACKTKTMAVKTSKTTIFRRYSPDSVKFDDAMPSSLQQIQPGDQLRARGDRNAEGSELTADEIVTGVFRNIAGTVNSVDASAGTINVQDLVSKKPVQIKITSDSQLHKLPPEMAQRMAIRLKAAALGGGAGGSGGPGGNSVAGAPAGGQSAWQGGPGGSSPAAGGGMSGGMRAGGAPDLNQMLSHTPVTTLADLNKGDAVVILATEGSSTTSSTAITLISGVDPILRASPSAGQAMMLAPWSLGAPAGDAATQ